MWSVTDPVDATLATYQETAQRYVDAGGPPGPPLAAFLDELVDLVPGGTVLEVGTGPGWDADHLESRGLRVLRSDATPAFVDRLRAAGHEALLLDVRDELPPGPFHAVLAQAILLHLDRRQLSDVLVRCRERVRPGGAIALTVKEGDGQGWTSAKLGAPRHFTYWREAPLREVLEAAGWHVTTLEHVQGRHEPWLYVLATPLQR